MFDLRASALLVALLATFVLAQINEQTQAQINGTPLWPSATLYLPIAHFTAFWCPRPQSRMHAVLLSTHVSVYCQLSAGMAACDAAAKRRRGPGDVGPDRE